MKFIAQEHSSFETAASYWLDGKGQLYREVWNKRSLVVNPRHELENLVSSYPSMSEEFQFDRDRKSSQLRLIKALANELKIDLSNLWKKYLVS